MKQLHDIVRPAGMTVHAVPNQIVLIFIFQIHVLMEVRPEEVAQLLELVAVKKASGQVRSSLVALGRRIRREPQLSSYVLDLSWLRCVPSRMTMLRMTSTPATTSPIKRSAESQPRES